MAVNRVPAAKCEDQRLNPQHLHKRLGAQTGRISERLSKIRQKATSEDNQHRPSVSSCVCMLCTRIKTYMQRSWKNASTENRHLDCLRVSVAMVEWPKGNLGRKSFFFSTYNSGHTPSLKEVTDAEAMVCCLLACSQGLLSLLPYSTQDQQSHSGLGPPLLLVNQENAPQTLQANLMKAFSQLRFPFQNDQFVSN